MEKKFVQNIEISIMSGFLTCERYEPKVLQNISQKLHFLMLSIQI